MNTSRSAHRDAGHAVGSRESLHLLLRVIDERTPGVLEDLNRVAHLATATAEILRLPGGVRKSRRAFTTSASSLSAKQS